MPPSIATSPSIAVTDDPVLCAPWTRQQEVNPVGSAGTYDRFLLVEQPLPWPDDVSAMPALAAAAARHPRTRVMAVAPKVTEGDDRVRIVDHQRAGTHRFGGTDHLVAAGEVADLLDALLDDPDADPGTAVGEAGHDVLVCTHGRRDRCCGRGGTLLHTEVAARLGETRVWRCSHTGGHRYAPTAITFPEGRFWAFLDADTLEGIVRRTAEPTALAGHTRGTCALDPAGQAVEAEVFARLGWSWLDHELTETTTEPDPAGDRWTVRLDWTAPDGSSGWAAGEVAVHRHLPVPACGEPLAAATKSSAELTVRGVEVSGGLRR